MVANKIIDRANFGLSKYGVGMDRTDMSVLQFLKMAQEESMDFCVYLERLIVEEELRAQDQKQQSNIEQDDGETTE
jgi:hypothetical protein